MAYQKQTWKDLPDQTTPLSATRLNHLETQYEEAISYTDSAIDSKAVKSVQGKPGPDVNLIASDLGAPTVQEMYDAIITGTTSDLPDTATVELKSKGQVFYEVMSLNPLFLEKWQPGHQISGVVPSDAREDLVDLSIKEKVNIAINCDALHTVSGGFQVSGLNIVNGVAVQNFGEDSQGIPGSDSEAVILTKNGELIPVKKSDNKTAQQYIDELGAVQSFGYGPTLVIDGQDTGWHTSPTFGVDFRTNKSARTIIGQDREGMLKVITVHGKTGSDGISGKEISDLALDEGCVIAQNLDGGGSTQVAWGGQKIHASSDTTQVRAVANAIVSTQKIVPLVSKVFPLSVTSETNQYMVGLPTIGVRKVGDSTEVFFNVKNTISSNTWTQLTNEEFPRPFRPGVLAVARGNLSAEGGGFAIVSLADDLFYYARNNTGSITAVVGTVVFPGEGIQR